MATTTAITPDVQKAWDKAKVGLMSRADSAFFTTVLFSLKLLWSETLPTAATDGLKIWINPTFFMKLDPEERIFLLIHEAMHVAYLHMSRRGSKKKDRWNIACDHYINLSLIERGFKMPKMGLADPQYKGLNPDQIYPLLPEQCQAPEISDLTGDAPGAGEPGLSDDVVQREVEDILVRAQIQSKLSGDKPGTIPGDIEIFLERLLNPKLPWQRILQKYLQSMAKNDYTFRRPNRRHFPAHYLPSLYSEKLMDLAIAIDASGSVSDADFNRFVSEIHSILRMMKPEKITLIQFTSRIQSVTEIRSTQELLATEFKGRGGTQIGPVLQWADEHKPKLLLVFTDGEFHFHNQTTKANTLWLIHNNRDFKADFGKVIHYDAKD